MNKYIVTFDLNEVMYIKIEDSLSLILFARKLITDGFYHPERKVWIMPNRIWTIAEIK